MQWQEESAERGGRGEEAFDVGGDLFIFFVRVFFVAHRYRIFLYFVKVYVWLLLCFSVEERRCYILNYTCPLPFSSGEFSYTIERDHA